MKSNLFSIRLIACFCVAIVYLSFNAVEQLAHSLTPALTSQIAMCDSEYEVTEWHVNSEVPVTVCRSGDVSSSVTVNYTTRNGTATDTNDYYAESGELSFAPGETQAFLTIRIRNDFVSEPEETFDFVLTRAIGPGVRLGTPSAAAITIIDDEDLPSLSVIGKSVQEAEAGKNSIAWAPILLASASSTETISVSYLTTDGTAVAGSDYVPATGTVTFMPGEDRKEVPITIIGDADNSEGRESFFINLTDPVNAPIGNSTASVTIVNHLPLRPQVDFDGDTVADLSSYSTSSGTWYPRTSNLPAVSFGLSTDTIVPADYTGDGRTDYAVFRPSTGTWWILQSDDSSHYAVTFGLASDIPVPADYDGDGRADIAVFRQSSGVWYVLRSSTGDVLIMSFGVPGDRPVPADYDGDWKADVAIFRPNEGTSSEWWIFNSGNGAASMTRFGLRDDRAVPADYTGDGKADISVWRSTSREWYVLRSDNAGIEVTPMASSLSTPAPGDYNGVGGFERAAYENSAQSRFWEIVMRPNERWYLGSGPGNFPVAGAYVR